MSDRDAVRRRWAAGEERLYPVVMVRPDLYAACLDLVRALVDRLGTVPDLDALVISYQAVDARGDLVAAGVEADGLAPEIDIVLVRDAAYQLRARELERREAADRTGRAIRRARQEGAPTVEIWPAGREGMPGHRSVEMALSTGRALVLTTEADAETFEPTYALEVIQLDRETGEAAPAEPLVARREFSRPDEWREAAARLRAQITEP